MLRVRIHGFSPEPIEVVTAERTPLGALEAIGRQVPELRPCPRLGPKEVEVVGHRTFDELVAPVTGDVIDVVPCLAGAKSGFGQILLGALLVAASFIPGIGQFAAGFLLKMGAMLILGGIAQLLNPTPKADTDANLKSRYLGSPKNTVEIGQRVPIIYGRRKWGGQYLSFDINAQQVKPYS